MPPLRDAGRVARQLRDVAAELDQVNRQVRGVEGRVQATVGASATGADRRMLAALGQVSGSTRRAQQALSAAATMLPKIPK
jgi:hypothetical protein